MSSAIAIISMSNVLFSSMAMGLLAYSAQGPHVLANLLLRVGQACAVFSAWSRLVMPPSVSPTRC